MARAAVILARMRVRIPKFGNKEKALKSILTNLF